MFITVIIYVLRLSTYKTTQLNMTHNKYLHKKNLDAHLQTRHLNKEPNSMNNTRKLEKVSDFIESQNNLHIYILTIHLQIPMTSPG